MATGRLSVPSEAGRLTGESSSVSARAGAFMMKSESRRPARHMHTVDGPTVFFIHSVPEPFLLPHFCVGFSFQFPELETGNDIFGSESDFRGDYIRPIGIHIDVFWD